MGGQARLLFHLKLLHVHANEVPRLETEATVKTCHDSTLDNLKAHVLAFMTTDNFARPLKALRWRTPYQIIGEAWTKDPSLFKITPHHLFPGPYT